MPSLKQLLSEGKIKSHKTSANEITGLLMIVNRDLKDAQIKELSADRKFTTAYNAALQLSTIILNCRSYRTTGGSHHYVTFQAVKEILGSQHHDSIDYFDACRNKRNITDYDYSGAISDVEVVELIKETLAYKEVVINWLKKNYPQYLK
ncbi:MAG: hypothetical protein KGZ86_03975 [Candidatus Latescibacteria bacterium]|nr:hypothetical protein [Candidatus Latescibacterota bacterium]